LTLTLNVIQDTQSDGNLICALISVANDLLIQLSKVELPFKIVEKFIWTTTALQTPSKVLIDPRNVSEASLSNNLV